MPNTSTIMIRAATIALPSWNAPLLDLCLLRCLRPMAWPFRRTPLALHCTECSSRGASPAPLGAELPLFIELPRRRMFPAVRRREGERHQYTQSAQCWFEHRLRGGSDGLE